MVLALKLLTLTRDTISVRDFELIQNSSILISVIRNLAVKKSVRGRPNPRNFFKNQNFMILWSFTIDKNGRFHRF